MTFHSLPRPYTCVGLDAWCTCQVRSNGVPLHPLLQHSIVVGYFTGSFKTVFLRRTRADLLPEATTSALGLIMASRSRQSCASSPYAHYLHPITPSPPSDSTMTLALGPSFKSFETSTSSPPLFPPLPSPSQLPYHQHLSSSPPNTTIDPQPAVPAFKSHSNPRPHLLPPRLSAPHLLFQHFVISFRHHPQDLLPVWICPIQESLLKGDPSTLQFHFFGHLHRLSIRPP